MDHFKQASKEKLRFPTTRGLLSVEQLWDLSLADLDALAVSLQGEYEKSAGKSFLSVKTTKDKGLKLQFDVALDILTTKNDEAQALKVKKEKKEHNKKILELIADKKDQSLKGKSIKQLEAMLEEEEG